MPLAGRFDEMIRVIKLVHEHFPECRSFRMYLAEALYRVGGEDNDKESLRIVNNLEASLSDSAVEPKILKGKLIANLMERDLAGDPFPRCACRISFLLHSGLHAPTVPVAVGAEREPYRNHSSFRNPSVGHPLHPTTFFLVLA
jgi:hypothetical protein